MSNNQVKMNNMMALAEYRDYLRIHPRLTYLFFELTDKCNMACIHCGSDCNIENKSFLDIKLICKVLDEVYERYGNKETLICLTGGEPLLYPFFNQLIEKIKSLSFNWGMTTNGLLIDQEKIDFFKKNNMGPITISIDGLEDNHDSFRGVKGSFIKTLSIVDLLKKKKITTQITTVVHKKNLAELEELYRLLEKHAIDSWRLINIEPIGRANDHKDYLLDDHDYISLLEFIKEKRFSAKCSLEVMYGCSHYLTYEYERMVRDNYFICGAGVYVSSVLCNGDIFSCLDIKRDKDLVQGNVSRDNFCDIWENEFKEFRKDRTKECKMCNECLEKRFCSADSYHTYDRVNKKPLICMKNIIGGEVNGR